MDVTFAGWAALVAGLVVLLLADLFLLHPGTHQISTRNAFWSTAGFIAISVAFGIGLGIAEGGDIEAQFFTGYLLEFSLSLDNVFVVAGAELLARFEWVVYVFGALLIYGGGRLLRGRDEKDPTQGLVARLLRRHLPTTLSLVGANLFARARHTGARAPGPPAPLGRLIRHAAAGRARRDRDDRRHLRGRLEPGDLRRSPTPATASTTSASAWRSSSSSSGAGSCSPRSSTSASASPCW